MDNIFQKLSIYEIVKKIVGSIEPYGNSNIDEERSNNLNEHIILTYSLARDLIDVAEFKDRPERSIHNLGSNAYDSLLELKEMIDDAINQ